MKNTNTEQKWMGGAGYDMDSEDYDFPPVSIAEVEASARTTPTTRPAPCATCGMTWLHFDSCLAKGGN